MPNPKKGESKDSYISRAVSEMMKSEGLSQKHALGKAYGMWDQAHGEHKLGVKDRRAWARSHGRGGKSRRAG